MSDLVSNSVSTIPLYPFLIQIIFCTHVFYVVLETTEHKLQQFILLTILPVAQILAQPSISPQSGHKGLQTTANHLKQATQRAASCNLNSEDSKFNTSVVSYKLMYMYLSYT